MIDTYNQQVQEECSCTIRTNINTANHHFIVEKKAVSYSRDSKGNTLNKHLTDVVNTIHTSTGHGGNTDCFVAEPQVLYQARTDFGKAVRKQCESGELKISRHDRTQLEPREDGVTNTITSVQKDNWLAEPKGAVDYEERGEREVVEHRYRIRKLTPTECLRLMGVEDADIDKLLAANISNTQLYRCAGNSIVVDVLYHIFRKCFCQKQNEHQQQTLF